MALRVPGLKLIRNAVQLLNPKDRPWRFLSFSYQDILTSLDELESVFGISMKGVPFLADSDRIIRWHKADPRLPGVPDFHEVMRRVGFEVTSLDLGVFRGVEEVADQNYPIAAERWNQYDVVLDNVAAHCFNVAQAVENVARAVKRNGLALHITPLAMVNQGYYSISPCLFHDFYVANGFEIIQHTGSTIARGNTKSESVKIDPLRRIKTFHPDTVQFVMARKKECLAELRWPTQEKFRLYPDCKETKT